MQATFEHSRVARWTSPPRDPRAEGGRMPSTARAPRPQATPTWQGLGSGARTRRDKSPEEAQASPAGRAREPRVGSETLGFERGSCGHRPAEPLLPVTRQRGRGSMSACLGRRVVRKKAEHRSGGSSTSFVGSPPKHRGGTSDRASVAEVHGPPASEPAVGLGRRRCLSPRPGGG